jgi:hypothetical protein
LGTKTTYAYLNASDASYYLTAYANAQGDEAKRQVRNQVTDEVMHLVDDDFEAFTRHLRSDRAYKNVFVKVISIGLTGAAPFSSGAVAKVLGGIDTGLKGISETVDVEAWGNQAPAILIDTMRAERAKVAKEISLMRSQSIADYTLEGALKDVGRYRDAGFVTTALTALARQTSEAATASELQATQAKISPTEVKARLMAK